MSRTALIALALALGACTADGSGSGTGDGAAGRHPVLQQPSVTEPGIHVSGYANIGVARRF